MDYELANRRILASYIKEHRRRPVKITMNEWAAKVGRSTRTMQAVERAEAVGPDTYVLMADALGVEPDVVFDILSSGTLPSTTAAASTSAQPDGPGLAEVLAEFRAEVLAEVRAEVARGTLPASSRARTSGRAGTSSQP